ncbi:serine protease [Pseudonocardia sp. TRM90224]|uniref:serine protease n=1 Tax=Pseudonocardia sp. TRM90224 TaxID=2812678 RepID=UPI001E451FCB|nr:serine protease [Pseudonocardia sp. TRM90224]
MPLSSQDHSLAMRAAARVRTPAGEVVGAGFLIGSDLVATCAHVVASAAGTDPYSPEPPDGPISLDFPLHDAAPVRAVVRRWLPIAEDGTGDVAVLELLEPAPAGARMPPLRRVDQLWDQRFRVLGFPEGMTDGVWSTGRIRGEQGTRWFQLQSDVGDQPIVEGFSGAPVWHEETGAVVGMTVAADASGRTTTAYLIPVEHVLGVDPELLPCPYRGLEPFDEEHAEFFFGRDTDVTVLVDALGAHPLVAVVGPSGVGKSSLVGAGLVPRLRAQGARIARLTPLPDQPVEPALAAALSASTDGDGRLVLVVDQFEELAAAQPDSARELLHRVGELVTAPEPIGAVLTLRSATLDEVLVPELAGLLSAGTVLVPPMQRGQLRDAIVAPAERAPGLSFEAGLVDRILDDAATEPGQLPLVESLLTELWSRRDGGYLTVAAYEQTGGVAGVIATHAEAVLAGFTDPDDAPRLRRLLTALARPDREGRFMRTSLAWADVAADLRPIVHRLAAGRLVVLARSANGAEHVQLAHQALIAHWPRLRDWLGEDRDVIAWRAQLDEQRERWEDADHDDGALLRGTSLSAALDRLPAAGADLSPANREYIRRSRALQRRKVRRWRVLTAVLAVLALAAGTLSVVAVNRGNRVNDQLRLANAELVAQAALARAGYDPVTATQLALTAWQLDPDNAAARTALVNQYLSMRSVDAIIPDVNGEGLDSLANADGTDRVLVRHGKGLAVIDGLAAGRPDRWDVPVPDGFRSGGLVDGGAALVAITADGDLLRWDLTSRTGPERTHVGAVLPATATTGFDPSGTRVGWTHQVRPGVNVIELRAAGTGAEVPHRIAPIEDPSNIEMEQTLDPDLVVIQLGWEARDLGPLQVRSLSDGGIRHTYPPGSATAATVPGTVVSCEQDGDRSVAVLRALADGTQIRRLPLITRCSAREPLEVSKGGRYLVEVSTIDGAIDSRVARITRLTDGRTFDLALPPNSRNALTPGRNLALAVIDGPGSPTVILAHGTSALRLRAHPVVTSGDGTAWPADDGHVIAFDQGGVAVYDQDFRRTVALTNQEAGLGPAGSVFIGDGLVVLDQHPAGWTITDFAVPSLQRRSVHELPATAQGFRPAIRLLPDRLIVFSGFRVTTWDRATGAQLYEPITFPEQTFHEATLFAVRPDRPDEVALPRNLGGELWDLRERRHLADVPLVGSQQPVAYAYSPAGDRLVGVTIGQDLDVRDRSDLQPVRSVIPVPGATGLLGVSQDGHALTTQTTDVRTVAFWDVDRGAQAGSFSLPLIYRIATVSDDGRYLRVGTGSGWLPFNLPLTADDWATRLCSLVDGPFPDPVRTLLPQGVELDRPCAGD